MHPPLSSWSPKYTCIKFVYLPTVLYLKMFHLTVPFHPSDVTPFPIKSRKWNSNWSFQLCSTKRFFIYIHKKLITGNFQNFQLDCSLYICLGTQVQHTLSAWFSDKKLWPSLRFGRSIWFSDKGHILLSGKGIWFSDRDVWFSDRDLPTHQKMYQSSQ